MSTQLRVQGRPLRGQSEVGRNRLLEMTRNAMKARPKPILQRREIAEVAGVTPALITYYFPKRNHLLEEAAKPVIEGYVERARAVLRSDEPYLNQVRDLACLFLTFNFEEGYLLDFYLETMSHEASETRGLALLLEIHLEMNDFFQRLLEKGYLRGESGAFIQSALWALCKYAAQQPSLAALATGGLKRDTLRNQSNTICDLFLNGIANP